MYKRLAHDRTRRVLLALLVASVMGFADLALTVAMMSAGGLYENNPLARHIAGLGWVWLVAFKLFTIAINVGLIWICRRRRGGEVGAWLSAAIMVALAVQWALYFKAGGAAAELAPDPALVRL